MASKRVDFLTPIGRLVQGDPFEPQTTDMQGQPLVVKTGPKMGQPTQRYVVNIAVDKRDPEFAVWYAAVDALARESWPQFFNGPVGANGKPTCTHPQMSLKVMDGDGVDGNGQPNSGKEGFAGCWIIKTASAFPPACYYKDHYAPHEQIKDKNLLRRGYFVRVGGSMESNSNPQKPGLYMNLGQIALFGLGPEITSGPSAQQVFGGAAAQPAFTPQGMQALPAMPTQGGGMATMPGVGAQPAGLPMQSPASTTLPVMPGSALPAVPSAPAATPAVTMVQPNPSILAGPNAAAATQPLPGAGLPQMPGMPGLPPLQPAAPAEPQLTPAAAAAGHTYAQFKQQGYTDDVLRANGYIV